MARTAKTSKKLAPATSRKAPQAKRVSKLRKAPKSLAAGALAGSALGHGARVTKNTAVATTLGAKNFVSGFLTGLRMGYAGA